MPAPPDHRPPAPADTAHRAATGPGPVEPGAPRRAGTLARTLLPASITVTVLASSSAPTPLYATYEREWGFGALTTTVVFGVYALAVLLALLVLGRLSDHLGRRPVLLVALAVQVVAVLVLATAPEVAELLLARVLQGLSTGAAVGAAGAMALDVDPRRGALANSVAPPVGTATGAVLSAAVVQFLPWPTHLVYLLLLALYVLQGVAVALAPETVRRDGTAWARALSSLVPRIGLPRRLRAPFAVAAPVVFAVWALAGLYGSLAPSLVRTVLGWDSPFAGASTLSLQTAVAAVTVAATYSTAARTGVVVAVVALAAGMALTLLALSGTSAAVFFLGTAVAGVGFGAGFQGGIRLVVPRAEPSERAGVLSSVYVAAYLGLGLPAVLAGFLVVHGPGLLTTARGYAVAVVVLAAVAALAMLRRPARG
ncbi:MFS transporter [Kineococcus rhizosphaerae]|uniref:Putative MFS family arabinose efflux permease n=1 Tax=Kineococcus rhizosphaerae TaxID=559628 RepID=A0A2T0R2R9_9ACTN|nr:MFS transporter [Kineococcus rhizosphaerae]PRY14099.1 putative MFS family arabinose efflux permease [Kineococcus rhizosphaerae]